MTPPVPRRRRGPERSPLAAVRPLLLAALAVLLVLCLPRPATAREYTIDKVDIDATVNADGSLDVVEARTFDFDGSFNGVYWDISRQAPAASSTGTAPQVSVTAVQDLSSQGTEFVESGTGQSGTYTVSDSGGATRVKIYAPHDDESATVRIAYKITGFVSAWADTGELYWKFVSDGWDVPSDNVTARIHLPVPAGTTVTAGENVRAWGHGPLDASLAFDGNDVVYTVPGVGTDEFAEARVTFPVAWLTGMAPAEQGHLQTILGEEQQWADEANAKREQARVLIAVAVACAIVGPVVGLVVPIVMRVRYRRSHRPQFRDTYFRDVPNDQHPAVLGCLYQGGSVSGELFTATLMRLTDAHAIELSAEKDGRGREADYVLTRGEGKVADAIDEAAMRVLFDVVAPRGSAGGHDSLRFSDIKRVAKDRAQEYADAVEDWGSEVKAACEREGYFTDPRRRGVGVSIAAVILGFVGGLGGMVAAGAMGSELGFIGFPLLFVELPVGFVMLGKMESLSAEAVELKAKLGALKKWLCDFTLLKEAVPRDVVLWNRLLVMAVVLGEAERVIEQLRTAAPEVLSDPGFYYGYCWYHGYGRLGSPAAAMSHAYDEAHTISAAELSSSSMSSGGGFGGGFSGGGGGGGGGGAF